MLVNPKTPKDLQIVPRALLNYGEGRPEFLSDSEKMLIKNFSSHPLLNDFFEKNSGFISLQWVNLASQDIISIHEHEVDTLMICCKGECTLIGETRKVLKEGDAIFIPQYLKHGLLCYDNQLFWGLSLRFYPTIQSLRKS